MNACGEREFRRHPIVGDEHLVPRDPHERRRERRVHHRRRTDVPAAVEVQNRGADLLLVVTIVDERVGTRLGATPQPGHAADDVVGEFDAVGQLDEGRHHDAAHVVEDLLHRPELLDRQSHRVAHERADGLAGDGLAEVVEQPGRTRPRLAERHPREAVDHALRESDDGQRGHRRRRGLDLRTISHHHAAQGNETVI